MKKYLKTLGLLLISPYLMGQDMTEYNTYFEQESKRTQPEIVFNTGITDPNHVFNFNHKDVTIKLEFEYLSDWQKMKLSPYKIVEDFKIFGYEVSKNDTTFSDAKNIIVKLASHNQYLLSVNNKPDESSRYLMQNQNLKRIKAGVDTFRIVYDYQNEIADIKEPIAITFIIDDYKRLDHLPWAEMNNFLEMVDSTLQEKSNQWKKIDAPTHQLKAYYIDNSAPHENHYVRPNKFILKDYTIKNNTINRLVLNPTLGIFTGYDLPIAFTMDFTLGYMLKYSKNSTQSFIGINYGIINPRFIDNNAFVDAYLGLEIGGYQRNNINIGNPKASITLGIFKKNFGYNEGMNMNLFEKPAFYMGIQYPFLKHFQLSLNMGSDFIFKKESNQYNYDNYLLGLGIKVNLGNFMDFF